LFGFVLHGLAEIGSLVTMMDGLDGLLQADSDEQTNNDGGDVDEEVSPGMRFSVGSVDVEHETECRA
jgi:hypothetical protein